jgi:uncharacterized protein (TIGR02611 family)
MTLADSSPPESDPVAALSRPGWRGRIAVALERARAHPTGRILVRGGVIVSGATVILVGVVLLPLPGPGWLIIFSGVAIWSIEFRWARRLLDFARVRVARWRGWYGRQIWPMKILFGLLTGVTVLVFVWAALRLSLGRDPWLIFTNGWPLGPA